MPTTATLDLAQRFKASRRRSSRAASEQGVNVSTWLADAAQAQVRQRRLREALDVLASEKGELDPAEIGRLIADARRTSRVVIGAEGTA